MTGNAIRGVIRPIFRDSVIRGPFDMPGLDLLTAAINAAFGTDTYTNNGSTDFDTLFTFSRSGSAHYRDSNGGWVEAADGVPRRNAHYWDGSAWRPGLLIETESRTNLLLNSETPATQSVTVTDATTYTLWVEGSGSAEITAGGSGTATDGTHLTFTTTGTSVTVTVTGSLDRFQLEEGPTPSSYIPTAGSAVTRAADTLKIPAAQLPHSSTAMSFAMKGAMTYADQDTGAQHIFLRWITGSGFIQNQLDTPGSDTGQTTFRQNDGTGTVAVVSVFDAYSPGVNVPFSIASRHTDHDINGAIEGTALTADATPTALPDLSATDLELAVDFMGILTEFKMWDRGLDDAELESESA